MNAIGDYVPLGELTVGTELHVQGGGDRNAGRAILVSKTWRQGGFEVFDFEVEGLHNFYVRGEGSDAAGVLVHNSSAPKATRSVDPEIAAMLEETKFTRVHHGGKLDKPGGSLSTTTSAEAADLYSQGGTVHSWRVPKGKMVELEQAGDLRRLTDSDPRLGGGTAQEVRFTPRGAKEIEPFKLED